MGGSPWEYFTPYQSNIEKALMELREQEFLARRWGYEFEENESDPHELIREYGSATAAMEAVLADSGADGTQSILDIVALSETPALCRACPVSEQRLKKWFGTAQPDRAIVERILLNEADYDIWEEFWHSVDRGTGRYIVLYHDNQPTEIFWAGCSFD